MTPIAYCHQHGLKVARFEYGKKRLLPPQAPSAALGAVPSVIPAGRAASNGGGGGP